MMLASSAVVHDRVFSAPMFTKSSQEELNKVAHSGGRSPSNSTKQAGTTLHCFLNFCGPFGPGGVSLCVQLTHGGGRRLVCRPRAVEAADLHHVGPAALVGGRAKPEFRAEESMSRGDV